MSNAVDLILNERVRQIVGEGYDVHHDDSHTDGQLAAAGASYALGAYNDGPLKYDTPQFWPEHWKWKPSPDPLHDLVRAGALIAAEIDRLLRMQGNADSYDRTVYGERDAAVAQLQDCERDLAAERDRADIAQRDIIPLALNCRTLVDRLQDAWWAEAGLALHKLDLQSRAVLGPPDNSGA